MPCLFFLACGARATCCSCGNPREKRPTASPCIPKPTASLGTRSTACGRQVRLLGNAWRRSRRGGQRALLLHQPALPNSRSGHLDATAADCL
eukprot:3983893-Prymnesium_polylepis.1